MTEKKIVTKPNLQRRIFAGLIDYGVILLVFGLFHYFFGYADDEGNHSLRGLPALSFLLFWAFWTIGSEQIFGVTLGNYLNELEVVSILSEPDLTFAQSFKRHFLDIFDLWLFGLPGILFIKNTKYNQRLGDLWAKTIVVDKNDSEQGRK